MPPPAPPVAALSFAALWGLCLGHGHMTQPPSRNGGTLAKAADCMSGECMWFSQPDAGAAPGRAGDDGDPIGRIPGEPTLNAAPLRTYNINVSAGPLDYTRHNPWRAPGSAPVIGSGCGRAGGGTMRQYNGGTAKEFGLVQNMDGVDLPGAAERVTWKRGTTVEVAWANNANHGGGYAYRLCKNVPGNVTEECFQRGHLDFVGDVQWLQEWKAGESREARPGQPPPPTPPPAGGCYISDAPLMYVGGNLYDKEAPNRTDDGPRACCKMCENTPECNFWTYAANGCHGNSTGCCWLKGSQGTLAPASADYTSGSTKPLPAPPPSSRVEIPRVTVSTGTSPAGSQWARVPIPACRYPGDHFGWAGCTGDDCGGCCATIAPLPPHPRINESWWRAQDCVAGCAGNGLPGSCPAGERQFPEPVPGMSSLWSSWLWCDAPRGLRDAPHDMPCSHAAMMRTNIVDKVRVPADLEPGDYLLSWRWDVEQTNQIWQNCADVTIAA